MLCDLGVYSVLCVNILMFTLQLRMSSSTHQCSRDIIIQSTVVLVSIHTVILIYITYYCI